MTEKKSTMAALGGNVIFGFSYMFSSIVLKSTEYFTMLSVRFIIAFLAMTVLLIFKVAAFDFRKNLKPLFAFGLLQPVLYFTLESLGIKLTNSVITGSIIAVVPIAGMVLAAIFLQEAFRPQQLLFACISLAGVLLISVSGQLGGGSLLGIVVLFGAVLAGSVYTLLSRKLSTEFTAFERTYAMFFVGAVAFTVIALIRNGSDYPEQAALIFTDWTGLFSMLYLSLISSVAAFFMLNYAVNALPVARSTAYTNIASVVSMFAGAIFLAEPVGVLHMIGCLLVLAGVYFTNKTTNQSQAS